MHLKGFLEHLDEPGSLVCVDGELLRCRMTDCSCRSQMTAHALENLAKCCSSASLLPKDRLQLSQPKDGACADESCMCCCRAPPFGKDRLQSTQKESIVFTPVLSIISYKIAM